MDEILYQKLGVIVSQIASDLLTKEVGDKISSVTEYQNKYQVSRGTVQNALSYLKQIKAVSLRSRGHLGTYIELIDLALLQTLCMRSGLLGIMPLPYSTSYAGLATAFYQLLSEVDFNMAYIRGSESRISLVVKGVYNFAICSYHAAINAMNHGSPIEMVMDFGEGSYLSEHVIVLKDPQKKAIEKGMRVAFDENSLDQREITLQLTKEIPDIKLIKMRAHQTVTAILADEIDAGVWNYDEIMEGGYQNLNIVSLNQQVSVSAFSRAVLIIQKESPELKKMLLKFLSVKKVRQIQSEVKAGNISANF